MCLFTKMLYFFYYYLFHFPLIYIYAVQLQKKHELPRISFHGLDFSQAVKTKQTTDKWTIKQKAQLADLSSAAYLVKKKKGGEGVASQRLKNSCWVFLSLFYLLEILRSLCLWNAVRNWYFTTKQKSRSSCPYSSCYQNDHSQWPWRLKLLFSKHTIFCSKVSNTFLNCSQLLKN